MSLQHVANHLAQHGRGNDKMLVHMTPKEVGSLQQLAQAHGGSLTINPHTGLPEAGFLDSLMPTLLGVGLSFVPGVGPLMAAGIVGGLQAARTGDIGKGLMAGLGAYGGAGIGAGLAGAGTAALSSEAGTAAMAGLSPEAIASGAGDQISQEAIKDRLASATPLDKLSAGVQGLGSETGRANLLGELGGGMGLAQKGLMAAAPMLTASQPTTSMPNKNPTAYVQTKMVNPYTKEVYDVSKVAADQWGGRTYADERNNADLSRYITAADGGLMGMTQPPAQGMFNYAQMQPAVDLHPNSGVTPKTMAKGGVAHFEDGGPVWVPDSSLDEGGVSLYPSQLATYAGGRYAPAAPAPAAPAPSAPAASAYTSYTPAQIQQYFAQNPGANVQYATQEFHADPAAVSAALGSAVPSAFTTPAQSPFTSYTNQEFGNFFADPKNASVLQTPGGLAAAIAQYKADPSLVNSYLQQNANTLGLSGGDIFQIQAGKGVQGVYDQMDKWVAEHPNATGAEVQTALKASSLNDKDVQNYFNRTNDKYGTNLATGKAFTGAGDAYQILSPNHGGLSDVSANITKWIQDHPSATLTDAQAAMSAGGINELDVFRATGKTSAQLYTDAKIAPIDKTIKVDTGVKPIVPTNIPTNVPTNLAGATSILNPATTAANAIQTAPATTLKSAVSGNTGAGIEGGGTVVNANGTVTESPVVPGIPQGGFVGMQNLIDSFNSRGGNTGYVPKAPSTMDEFNARYNKLSGGSKQAFDYLQGKADYTPVPSTKDKKIMKPYSESVLGVPQSIPDTQKYYVDSNTGKLTLNKNYNSTASSGGSNSGSGIPTVGTPVKLAGGITGTPVASNPGYLRGTDGKYYDKNGNKVADDDASFNALINAANGGLMGMAHGGSADEYNLGSYSDGGRLLRGPGDGVSDSIPATIGKGQPARLADGEFVVPARIVSELGNGSTEAGAKQLYAMMDRIQKARSRTVGKGRVATNTKASKYLPA
jgi:hypothetical protein